MTKKFQRVLSCMLAVMLVVLMSPAVVLEADALQSRTGNFLKTYTLTGDGAADMVAIALAQEGRTGSEFGYTEQWCANFASDCAILAGQTKAVPANGSASGLYTAILNAGGSISTSNPKPGDLCFINWNGGSTASHVEIVYQVSGSALYTIGGNSGSTGSLYTRYVKKHKPIGASYVLATVRPAYTSQVVDYLAKCTAYNSYANVTAASGAVLWSLPCTSSVTSQSIQMGKASAGDTFVATAMYLNTVGEYWYEVTLNGAECFLYGGNTTAVSPLYSDLSISSVKAPSTVQAGNSFSIGGTIATKYNLITGVDARVVSNNTVKLNGTATGLSTKSYSLRSSTVDKSMKFATLDVGSYTYNVRATVKNSYTTDGTKRIDGTDTQVLYQNSFQVVDGTAPVISDVTVSDLTSKGYTVSATVTDDVELDYVVFSSYAVGGEEITGTTVDADGTSYSCKVWTSEHDDATGPYVTDITAYDASGNATAYSLEVQVPELAGGSCGAALTWALSNKGVLTISGTGAMKNFASKTDIPWYAHRNDITTVVIEEGVTSISDHAFYGMPHLKTIDIPETVTSIGLYAFKNCTALDNVVLPAGLSKLGESSFYGCISLPSIEIPASLWSIQPYTFKNCTDLQEVTFQEGNLMKIWDGAFYNTGLTGVVLPDCLEILDTYVFKNCADLAYVNLGDGITEIREAAFYGTALPAIELTDNITAIGPYAFKNCLELDTVLMTENLKTIGESAFFGCTGLSWMEFPEGLTTIDGYAFKRCTTLTQVTLPSTLTTLGDSAFYTCTAMTELTIPENVQTIGEYCFAGSYNLWKMNFRGDAPAIGSGAFRGLNLTAYYSGSNATWTSDVMQNYGGTVTWKAQ